MEEGPGALLTERREKRHFKYDPQTEDRILCRGIIRLMEFQLSAMNASALRSQSFVLSLSIFRVDPEHKRDYSLRETG